MSKRVRHEEWTGRWSKRKGMILLVLFFLPISATAEVLALSLLVDEEGGSTL
ncbi:MAG TPA: hypothetical protein VNN62_07145 [Methylomirabilota bacterium]|jgi:hypothetical protein|nr:hypothetical protein [Methylomirabilota bacterium]